MSEALAAWNGYAFDPSTETLLREFKSCRAGGRMIPAVPDESGGSEGLASTTTDVYRAPAPGPSAPKPPGQPAIGGGLV